LLRSLEAFLSVNCILVVLSSQRVQVCPSIRANFYPELPLSLNLNSPQRRLIALRMEHSDLDALIDQASEKSPTDELMMRRLKKRRLALRDEIARIEQTLLPDEPA
jgi:hypothetical protein